MGILPSGKKLEVKSAGVEVWPEVLGPRTRTPVSRIGPEEISLEFLALFIHLRKSAGSQDDGFDPAGGAIANRLGVGGGRQNDRSAKSTASGICFTVG